MDEPALSRFPRVGIPASHPELFAAFAPCVNGLGCTCQLPESATAPAADDWAFFLNLSEDGVPVLSHTYTHSLAVARSSGLIYILQDGGFFGSRTVCGPFHADIGCLAFPPIGRDWMSLEAAVLAAPRSAEQVLDQQSHVGKRETGQRLAP